MKFLPLDGGGLPASGGLGGGGKLDRVKEFIGQDTRPKDVKRSPSEWPWEKRGVATIRMHWREGGGIFCLLLTAYSLLAAQEGREAEPDP